MINIPCPPQGRNKQEAKARAPPALLAKAPWFCRYKKEKRSTNRAVGRSEN